MADGDLLAANDFAKFKAKDEEWFLGAAGDVIRDACGWHLYPVVSLTNQLVPVGEAGIIMLPSLNLVSIERVLMGGVELPAETYEANSAGFITLRGHYHPRGGTNGPYTGTQGLFRRRGSRWVTVDYTHGFESLPRPVMEVGFELTARTLEKPAGVAKSLSAGPNSFQFNEFGMVLTDDQLARLGPYTVIELT